jgi:hypothetical protein
MEKSPMSTSSFLNAEEGADKLVQALGQLEDETRRFSSAAKTLEGAGTAVQGLSASVGATAQRTKEAVEAILAVGGPAIVDGLSKLSESTNGLALRLQHLETAMQETSKRVDSLRSRLWFVQGLTLALVIAAVVLLVLK